MENSKEPNQNKPVKAPALDFGAAESFIQFIAGDDPVTFQTFGDAEDVKGARIEYGTFADKRIALKKLSEAGHGVFLTINKIDPGAPGKRRNDLVSEIRAVFMDFDGHKDVKSADEHLDSILSEARDLGIPVNGVVFSRGDNDKSRFHLYWLVDPVAVSDDGVTIAKFKQTQKALAAKWQGDVAINDPARVMRIPGFNHLKGTPQQTTCKIYTQDRISLDSIVEAIGVPETHIKKDAEYQASLKNPKRGDDNVVEILDYLKQQRAEEVEQGIEGTASFYYLDPKTESPLTQGPDGPLLRADNPTDLFSRLKDAIEFLSHAEAPEESNSLHWCEQEGQYVKSCWAIKRALLSSDIDEEQERELVTALSATYNFRTKTYDPLEGGPDSAEYKSRAAEAWDAYEEKAQRVLDDPGRGDAITIQTIFKWAWDNNWDGHKHLAPPELTPIKATNFDVGSFAYHQALRTQLNTPITLSGHTLSTGEKSTLPEQLTKPGKNGGQFPAVTVTNVAQGLAKKGIWVGYNVITKTPATNIQLFPGGDSPEKDRSAAFASCIRDWIKMNFFGAPGGLGFSDESLSSLLDGAERYNPVVAYLSELEWDGVDRLPELADCFTCSDRDVLEYGLRKFLISTVAAADYAENSPLKDKKRKFDLVLVLQGPQGIGKTQFFGDVLPDELRQYYRDGVRLGGNGTESKDAQFKAAGCLVCELGEIDSTFTKKGNSELKGFLSQSEDILRKPYGRDQLTMPRRTVFVGSVNQLDFLSDQTGARRFIPVSLRDIDLRRLAEIDKDQLWAQVWQLYLGGAHWWIDPKHDNSDALTALEAQRKGHRQRSDAEELIETIIEALHDIYDFSVLDKFGVLDKWSKKGYGERKRLEAAGCKPMKQSHITAALQVLSSCGIAANQLSSNKVGKALINIAARYALQHGLSPANLNREHRGKGGRLWMMPPDRKTPYQSDVEADEQGEDIDKVL